MDDNKKLELINSMEVIDFSADGGEMEYVLVDNTQENREILFKIGMTDLEIDDCCTDDDCFDIVNIGFKYADQWWENKGFGMYPEPM